MINNFFHTVQEDSILVYKSLTSNTTQTQEQERKVSLASLRLIASVGMLLGGLITLAAFPSLAVAPLGTLFKMAIGAAIYAAGHDVFVMAKNASDQQSPVKGAVAGFKSGVMDLFDLAQGKKSGKDALRHPITEDTIFRPLWDEALARASS